MRWVSKSDELSVYLTSRENKRRNTCVCTAESTRMVHSQGNNKDTMYSEVSVDIVF
jgi:hypothetical protein